MHAKFNKWELESPEGSWFELKPAGASSEGGADWWSASIQAGSEYSLCCNSMLSHDWSSHDGDGLAKERVHCWYAHFVSPPCCGLRALNCTENRSQLVCCAQGGL